MRSVRPTVTTHEILERPDYAAGQMDASTKAATDYTAAALGVAAALAFALTVSKLIKHAAGPYGGIIDLVGSVFKGLSQQPVQPARQPEDTDRPDHA